MYHVRETEHGYCSLSCLTWHSLGTGREKSCLLRAFFMEWNFRTGELKTLSRFWSLSSRAEARAGGNISYPGERNQAGSKVRSHPEDGPWPVSPVVVDEPQMQQLKIPGGEFPWHCIPLIPDLHHCGLPLLQGKTSFMGLSFCLNFLQPFPSISMGVLLQSGLNHPRGCNIQPKTLSKWNSANKNWTSQHGHFSLLKGGLHYLLVAPEGQAGLLLSACFLI